MESKYSDEGYIAEEIEGKFLLPYHHSLYESIRTVS